MDNYIGPARSEQLLLDRLWGLKANDLLLVKSNSAEVQL